MKSGYSLTEDVPEGKNEYRRKASYSSEKKGRPMPLVLYLAESGAGTVRRAARFSYLWGVKTDNGCS